MAYKGLSRDKIVEAARELVEKEGLRGFSLRVLAAQLGVRVSSLYNHVSGQEELLTELGRRAVDMLCARETAALEEGRCREAALFALGEVWRAFAWEHPELYRILMGVHNLCLPELEKELGRVFEPFFHVIDDYGLTGPNRIHALRLVRSVMHGFFAHEHNGGFMMPDADREESYRIALECVAAQFEKMSGEEPA